MADRDVLGKSAIVEMKVDGLFFPVFCATVNEFQYEQAEIETTHINSGPNREFVPGMGDGSVSVTGITRVNNADSRVNIFYLLQQSIRRQIHEIRMVVVDQVTPTPNAATMTFNAFIRSTGITNDKASLSNSSVTFRITGGITFGSVVPAPVEPVCEVQSPLYIDTTPGATSVQHALLEVAGAVILKVEREGVGHDQTDGTPVGREYKFTGGSGNGIIAFDPNIPLGTEVVYVLYKIPI